MGAAIGIVVLWAGYSIAYYGWNRITGGNDSFRSLIWPGDYKPTTRDSGSGGGAPGPGAPGQPPALPPGMTSPTGKPVGTPIKSGPKPR